MVGWQGLAVDAMNLWWQGYIWGLWTPVFVSALFFWWLAERGELIDDE